MRIAIVGAGIAGLGSAWLLQRQGHAVTLFEAEARLGGHSHTVDVTLDGVTHPVDTGFLVFNDRTYPRLVRLFEALDVRSVATTMSFSVRDDASGLEWAGTSLATLLARPRNALSRDWWRMLADVVRFNRAATALATRGAIAPVALGDWLDRHRYSRAFRDGYLLPMAGAIWSSPKREIERFPLPSFVRFCHNHGLLSLTDRPQWRTVAGGSRVYVERIARTLADVRCASPVAGIRRRAGGVEIDVRGAPTERFDAVVLACHSDQAIALLSDASSEERRLLSAIRYQRNRVVLHTDPALLPRRRAAWSSWNYLAADDPSGERPVAVSYLINRLQPLPFATPVVVTLNPPFEPDPASVIAEYDYAHPLLDAAALAAQPLLKRMQGVRGTFYAGAWLGYGFHEDGLASAHAVAERIGIAVPAATPATLPANAWSDAREAA